MELETYRLNEARRELKEQLEKETVERDKLREISPWMLSLEQQKRKEHLEKECIQVGKLIKTKKRRN